MIAFIEAQGSLLRMKVAGYKSRPNASGGKRGKIKVFSRGSRLRLMRFMARLKTKKIRATFITLTFSKVVTNEHAKKVFKRFAMRVRRKFDRVSAVWRMELQERGAIHFHLLAFNLPFWKQAEIQKVWEECTEEDRSIIDIRLVHGSRSVMSYISKYIAKPDERTELTSLEDVTYQHAPREELAGRFWGWIQKELLPLGNVNSGVLTDSATIKSLSSFAWAILGSDNPYNSISFHLFADNATWLYERAIEEGGCDLDEWEFTVKDHTNHKPTYNPYTDSFSQTELDLISVPTVHGKYRPNEVSLSQPVLTGWLARSSKVVRSERILPYFDEYGRIAES